MLKSSTQPFQFLFLTKWFVLESATTVNGLSLLIRTVYLTHFTE